MLFEFYDSKQSCNVPGRSYIWLGPTTDAKCTGNKIVSRNKLSFILKVENTTVHVLKMKVNSLTNASSLDSVFCHISTNNKKKKRKRKTKGGEIMVQCFICFKSFKMHNKCFANYYGKWSKHNHLFHCKKHA